MFICKGRLIFRYLRGTTFVHRLNACLCATSEYAAYYRSGLCRDITAVIPAKRCPVTGTTREYLPGTISFGHSGSEATFCILSFKRPPSAESLQSLSLARGNAYSSSSQPLNININTIICNNWICQAIILSLANF